MQRGNVIQFWFDAAGQLSSMLASQKPTPQRRLWQSADGRVCLETLLFCTQIIPLSGRIFLRGSDEAGIVSQGIDDHSSGITWLAVRRITPYDQGKRAPPVH